MQKLISFVLIIFCHCFISCIEKKNITEPLLGTERLKKQNASQNNEADNFQGLYVFSKTEVIENINIDISEYTDFDEKTYIKMTRTGEGKYIMDTNFWLILSLYPDTVEIKYPNGRWNEYNYNKKFDDRFFQIAADGSTGGVYMDFFYTGTEIVLYYISTENEGEEVKEQIECYIYFSKAK